MSRSQADTWGPNLRTGALFLWVASLGLGALFLVLGASKFFPTASEVLARHGLPDWWRVPLGLAEIAGGLMLFVPRAGAYGACLLGAVVLTWTIGTRVLGETPRSLLPAVVVLGLLLFVGCLRRPGAWDRRRLLAVLDRFAEHEMADQHLRRNHTRAPHSG
jgi:hypothetical protein